MKQLEARERKAVKRAIASRLELAAGGVVLATAIAAVPAESAVRPPVVTSPVERAAHAREALTDSSATRAPHGPPSMQLAWWGNWHNWGWHPGWHNWPNWHNWRNWGNGPGGFAGCD